MNDITAVLIDTVSIQKYIFSSNRLSENLGASFIIENIFDQTLKETLSETTNMNDDSFENWKEKNKNSILDTHENAEIGYIGGGNALLFFEEENKAKEFLKTFSRKILLNTPGVTLGMTYRKVNKHFVENDFQSFLQQIFEQLKDTKNKNFPNVKIQKYGITKDCPLSNEAADSSFYDSDNELKFVSTISKTKRQNSTEAIQNRHEKFRLTTEIDKLGQKEGDNWIAVVHIDGNNMGIKFQQCHTLNQLRQLSTTVKKITNDTFEELLQDLKNQIQKTKALDKILNNANEILPIRPIVIGGDDVTFVCNANLALYLTERFIQLWTKKMNQEKLLNELKFSSCGGIAYVKTKYPFYQSYQMAEELCTRAKKLVKKEKEKEQSAIDFYIQQGSISGNINTLIDEKLHFGPYYVEKTTNHKNTVNELTEGIRHFSNWPRAKRKGLRDVLSISETATKKYINELRARGLRLPNHTEPFSEYQNLDDKKVNKTPYMDIIEIMELYPEPILVWRCAQDEQ